MPDLDPNAPNGAPPAEPNTTPAPPAAAPPPPAPERPRNPVSSLQLPETALLAKKEKWQRKAREALLAELGIKDVEAFKRQAGAAPTPAPAAEPEALAQALAAAPLATSEDVKQLREHLAAIEEERRKFKKKYKRAKLEAQRNQVEVLARDAAADHIDPAMYEFAAPALRKYISALPERDQAGFDQEKAKKFFADLARKQPAFARKQGGVPAPAAGVRKPLTTGPSPARAASVPPRTTPVSPQAKPGKITEKSSPAEVDAAFANFGIKYNPPGRAGGAAARPNGSPR